MTDAQSTTINTREAAKRTGLTYGQLRYLLRTGVIFHEPVKAGEERRFTEKDVLMIELAASLRKAGIGIQMINNSVLHDMFIQPPTTALFYAHTDKKLQYAAYWDCARWTVKTTLREIIELRDEARKRTCLFLYNKKEEGEP